MMCESYKIVIFLNIENKPIEVSDDIINLLN